MRSSYISKLAIGTVQFGLDYGISNAEGKTKQNEIGNILDFARQIGITTLDTAYAYGTSELMLGRHSDKDFEIISKFPNINGKRPANFLAESLANLRKASIYGYLAHSAEVIFGDPSVWEDLTDLRGEGKVNKIGYSLYHPYELDKLLEMGMVPDLVQIPYNLLDRRFESSLASLKELEVEVHTRSAFLQGLLLMDISKLSAYFTTIKKELKEFNKLTLEERISHLLLFPLSNKYIDKVVIGVNNANQLQSNIQAIQKENLSHFSFKIEDESLLNPSNWPKADGE